MSYIAISARLGNDPKAHDTKTGKPMCTAFAFGQLENRGEEEITFPLNVIAFGFQAEALLRHEKGQFITISGKLQGQMYNGEQRLSVIADSIISARAAQPKGGKQKTWADQKASVDKLHRR